MNDGDGNAVDGRVPVRLSKTIAKPPQGVLRAHSFEALRHTMVEVDANGFRYRGRLVGADEHEIFLRGETRWWVLPLMQVTAVTPLAVRRARLGDTGVPGAGYADHRSDPGSSDP